MHALVVIKDAVQATRFYAEVQKQITESLKRLLGLSHLNLWENRIMVARVLDLSKAKERIEYLYLNPARASLVNSISEYPGVSSWDAFARATTPKWVSTESVAWIRQQTIEKLPSRTLKSHQDRYFSDELLHSAKAKHDLDIFPNAWLEVFGITDPGEIEDINKELKTNIRSAELKYQSEREKEGKKAIGPARLREEAILKPHTPKKKDKRIYVLSSLIELRVEFIEAFKALTTRCEELYRLLCQCKRVVWPHGIFPPQPPPLANVLA